MINLIFFITTKGHFGRKDLYKYTLKNFNSLNEQNSFDKYLSIKIFKDDESQADKIISDFNYKTFKWYNPDPNINEESPYKDYAYYLLTNYLGDIVNTYSQQELLKNEYTFIYEDDSPIIIKENNFKFYLDKAIQKLSEDKDLFSVHFQRVGELNENKEKENISFFTENHDYNFQNQLFRTKDMFDVANIIKSNWSILRNIHTERAVKLAIDAKKSNFKHLSFMPSLAHSIHIGIQQSEEIIKKYQLSI